MSVLVIAEAGVNHNGDMRLARGLIEAAADAGADYVKFQTFRAGALAAVSAGKAEYQTRSTGAGESQRDMLSRLELSPEMHDDLLRHCAASGIRFLSSAFDVEGLDLLDKLGVDQIKIPSGELTNLPYLRRAAALGRPIILSTGMATMDDIRAALDALESAGASRAAVTVLHCTTEYPAPMGDVNLRAMRTIGEEFGVAVGYSDHTTGTEVAIAAVALGATIIEKHLTLDKTLSGPDHAASLEPGELREMIGAIRNVELALGRAVKAPTKGESSNARVARKSLVALRAIRAGEMFTAENLGAKRPGTGISPMRWDEVIGTKAVRDFAPDELVEL